MPVKNNRLGKLSFLTYRRISVPHDITYWRRTVTKTKSERLDVVAKQSSVQKRDSENELSENTSSKHWPFDNGSFAPFHSLRREVDGIFNQFTDRFDLLSRHSSDVFQVPALDVDETETAFEISAELPGVAEQDIDVSVTNSVLTIHGEKQQRSEKQDADQRISECSYGVFERSLTLPFKCDAKAIEAKYDNGVLHLTIPKPKQVASKTQKVAIKSAA